MITSKNCIIWSCTKILYCLVMPACGFPQFFLDSYNWTKETLKLHELKNSMATMSLIFKNSSWLAENQMLRKNILSESKKENTKTFKKNRLMVSPLIITFSFKNFLSIESWKMHHSITILRNFYKMRTYFYFSYCRKFILT